MDLASRVEYYYIINIIDVALALESDDRAISNLHWTVVGARSESLLIFEVIFYRD